MEGMPPEHLRVDRDGVVLAGSLWSPGPTPRSVVLMHPGSGASDRHNDVLFPPIRTALLAAGHAVASFDKRGVGESTGALRTTSIEQQADDLLACLGHLRDRTGGTPIGVFGHSQGGWVAYEAMGRDGHPDFGVANSGPGVAPAVQERHALRRATAGHPDQAAALELFDELVTLAAAGTRLEAVSTLVDIGAAGALRGFAADLLGSEDVWDLASSILAYDPATALGRIRVPVLAVFGADDPIVPVDASIGELRRRVDPYLLRVAVFEHAGHRIEAPSGALFADGYLDTVIGFVDGAAT